MESTRAAFAGFRTALRWAFGLLFAMAGVAFAQPLDREINFNIPAQPLASAVIDFSKQAEIQILASGEKLNGVTSPGIRGRFSIDRGLRALLVGTGFTYRHAGQGTVTLVKAADASQTTQDATLVAQAAGSDTTQSAQRQERIEVTGSRVKRVDIEGPSPIVVFTRKDIERTGAVAVGDVLNRITQNSTSANDTTFGSSAYAGSSTIRLRGITQGGTLTLINGRPIAASAGNFSTNYFDVNAIPLEAVERIEVLTDTAAAAYGADAIAGAVNFILRRNYDGGSLTAATGTSYRRDATNYQAGLLLGTSGVNGSSLIALQGTRQNPLSSRDREITSDRDYRRLGGTDFRSTTAYPANVFALPSQGNLPGLNSTIAATRPGSTGVGLTPADFNAGILARYNADVDRSLIVESERKGIFASGTRKVTSDIDIYAELFESSNRAITAFPKPALAGGSVGSFRVPADNPFNPFGVAVGIDYVFEELAPRRLRIADDFSRAVVGSKGRLAKGFEWEIYGYRDRGTTVANGENFINAAAVQQFLSSSNPTTALNVFSTTRNNSPATLAAILSSPIDSFSSKSQGVDAVVRGEIAALPAGSISAAIGGNARQYSSSVRIQQFTFQPYDASRKTRAAFGEVLIPIISPAQRVSWAHALEVTAAIRYDTFSEAAIEPQVNHQLGIGWRPLRDVLIRTSYGTAFKMPSFFSLYSARNSVPFTARDPARNNESSTFNLVFGGNPNLLPEQAMSQTVGLVWEPVAMPGLAVLLNAFRLRQQNSISTSSSPDLLLQNASLFSDRIVRAPQTAAEAAAGLPGRLVSVDTSALNFGEIEARGVDIHASYAFVLGQAGGTIRPSISVTYYDRFDVGLTPGAPIQNQVNRANFNGWPVRTKAAAQLAWESGIGLSMSTTARYMTSYKDFDGVRMIPANTLWDAQVSYSPPMMLGLWKGFGFTVGVENIGNRQGPLSNNSFGGYDFQNGDMRGRFMYVRARQTF